MKISNINFILFWLTSLWAISLSWCGNFKSTPPVWISKEGPKISDAIAEHSMCQPGLPRPQGESQAGSPGLLFFQSAKSFRDCFSCLCSAVIKSPLNTKIIILYNITHSTHILPSPSNKLLVSPYASGTNFA